MSIPRDSGPYCSVDCKDFHTAVYAIVPKQAWRPRGSHDAVAGWQWFSPYANRTSQELCVAGGTARWRLPEVYARAARGPQLALDPYAGNAPEEECGCISCDIERKTRPLDPGCIGFEREPRFVTVRDATRPEWEQCWYVLDTHKDELIAQFSASVTAEEHADYRNRT